MDALFGIILAASLIGWISTRYSIFCLPFLVSLSILAQDSFYPLSYFPMYSDPDESENYLYLATFPLFIFHYPIHLQPQPNCTSFVGCQTATR